MEAIMGKVRVKTFGEQRARLIGYAWHGCEQSAMRMVTHRVVTLPDDLYDEAFARVPPTSGRR
jgi:hypothetical protein